MGLFRKKDIDDSMERELKRDLAGEVLDLREKIGKQNAQLQEDAAKLEAVRAEYNETVSRLMKIKKELGENRRIHERLSRTNTEIRDEIEKGRMILRNNKKEIEQARNAAEDLAGINAELESKTAACREAQERLDQLRQNAAEAKSAAEGLLEGHKREIAQYREKLATSEEERASLQSRLHSHYAMVKQMQERIDSIEARRHPPASHEPDKGVVRAASSLVASFRKRLEDAQAELDLERSRHAETKKRLEKYERHDG